MQSDITVRHTIQGNGYKIQIKTMNNWFILYLIENETEIIYGEYDNLDVALECAEALLKTV